MRHPTPLPRARAPRRRHPSPALLAGLVAASLAAPSAGHAATPSFGLSGIFDLAPGAWSDLDADARASFLSGRGALGVALGASVLRLGTGAPDIFSESALQGTFPWMFADRAARLLASLDAEVVVTLRQLAPAPQRTAYRQFLTRLFERYDGDTDFAVEGAAVQFDHPDVDDSGTISFLDWDAAPAAKQQWADAHRLGWFELGDRLRAAEDDGFEAADYPGMVSAAHQAAASATGTRLALGGTDLDVDSRNRFLDRVEGVGAIDGLELSHIGGHLRGRAGALDSGQTLTILDNFAGWVRDAGLDDAELWLTEVAVGAAPAGDGPGPCADPRCSERTQVHGLTRAVLSALARGYTRVLYAGAVELDGTDTTVGLLTAPAAAALDLSVDDLRPRPAYAVWRLLTDIVTDGPVARVGALPTNAHGVEVPTGWVLWFDWSLEVGPGQPYDPLRRKEIVLRGLTAPAVKVTSLWPSTVGDSVGADGAVAVTWAEEVVPVEADGTVVITVEQDPVWVSPAATVVVEEGAPDVSEGGDDVAEAEPSAGPRSDDGGCASGGGATWPLGLAATLGLLAIPPRRRPTQKSPAAPSRAPGVVSARRVRSPGGGVMPAPGALRSASTSP